LVTQAVIWFVVMVMVMVMVLVLMLRQRLLIKRKAGQKGGKRITER